jgi:hypothetical protein
MMSDFAKKIAPYRELNWTKQQKELLHASFERLDALLFSCEKEGNSDKINAIKKVHEQLHDMTLASSLDDILS